MRRNAWCGRPAEFPPLSVMESFRTSLELRRSRLASGSFGSKLHDNFNMCINTESRTTYLVTLPSASPFAATIALPLEKVHWAEAVSARDKYAKRTKDRKHILAKGLRTSNRRWKVRFVVEGLEEETWLRSNAALLAKCYITAGIVQTRT
jgi:hypothetical protein